MDNNTVILSVIEDLIHWPLPTQFPAADVNSVFACDDGTVDVDALWRDDVQLTAGGAEDINEEPRERRRSRYNAVRRLPALARMLGPLWVKTEVIPYMLRCIEEDDAELSFATCLALIDIATSPQSNNTDMPTDGSSRHFSLENFLIVLVRMAATTDTGVRRFLADVVIPKLFFGVMLERTVDLRDWETKYLDVRSNKAADMDADDETEVTFEVKSNDSELGTSARRSSRKPCATYGISDHGAVWDVFEINLYANRLRSDIATYLHGLTADGAAVKGAPESLTSHEKIASVMHDYTKDDALREALCARWGLFVRFIDTLLKSEYAAAVSVAVECIGNIFSCISWAECIDQRLEPLPLSLSSSLALRSVEELSRFTFIATRTHVSRAVRSGAKNSYEGLVTALFANNLLLKNSTALSTGVEDCNINLGCGGYSIAEREIWDFSLGNCAPRMHRVVRMSILRSLSHFIDWSNGNMFEKAVMSSSKLNGLTFYSVCDIFTRILVTSYFSCSFLSGNEHKNTDKDGGGINTAEHNASQETVLDDVDKKGTYIGESCELLLELESDVSRDFGIAEAVFDGFQQILEDMLHPHLMEALLSNAAKDATCPTFEEKKAGLMRLCAFYRDCIIFLVMLPSWKTRWLATQRIPKLTATFLELLRCVADSDANDGAALVEMCVVFLSRLYIEQWSLSPPPSSLSSSASSVALSSFLLLQGGSPLRDSVGVLWGLVRDAEEEVRSAVAMCAASVFRDLGQSMFCFVFPRGVVCNMHANNQAEFCGCGIAATSGNSAAKFNKDAMSDNKDSSTGGDGLLFVDILFTSLTALFDVVLSCCVSLLHDTEERVRSGAAAGLSELVRTLSVMAAVSDLHLKDLGKETWLRYLDNTTASLLSLLEDKSPAVQIALLSELTTLFESATTGALRVREKALVECLKNLSSHAVWRYRERFANLLSDMCVKFLLPNSSAVSARVVAGPPPPLELALSYSSSSTSPSAVTNSLKKNSLRGERAVVVGKNSSVNRMRQFAREELLPLFVDVLFDKVKAVRDSALKALEKMCDQLCRKGSCFNSDLSGEVRGGNIYDTKRGAYGGRSGTPQYNKESLRSRSFLNCNNGPSKEYGNSEFINKTLWPLIIKSPRAMATYLSRSSLLRIAVCLGVDKTTILFPLLNYLGRDAVLNVRIVVAKELFGILSSSATGNSRVTFTEKEKNGVVLQLLRLLVGDQSVDVRNEASKALKLCF